MKTPGSGQATGTTDVSAPRTPTRLFDRLQGGLSQVAFQTRVSSAEEVETDELGSAYEDALMEAWTQDEPLRLHKATGVAGAKGAG